MVVLSVLWRSLERALVTAVHLGRKRVVVNAVHLINIVQLPQPRPGNLLLCHVARVERRIATVYVAPPGWPAKIMCVLLALQILFAMALVAHRVKRVAKTEDVLAHKTSLR